MEWGQRHSHRGALNSLTVYTGHSSGSSALPGCSAHCAVRLCLSHKAGPLRPVLGLPPWCSFPSTLPDPSLAEVGVPLDPAPRGSPPRAPPHQHWLIVHAPRGIPAAGTQPPTVTLLAPHLQKPDQQGHRVGPTPADSPTAALAFPNQLLQ